jgi:2-polyprenyl-3-methyl-5-hydroxy-6-metoxy-1,4-benzoquinol methylase
MPSGHLKRTLKRCCPPLLWSALRRLGRRFRSRVRILRSLEELDREMIRIDTIAAEENDDAMRRALNGFRFDPGLSLPADPHSAAYAEAQKQLYELVAGRQTYQSAENEYVALDLKHHVDAPFPYATRSSITVGEQLMAIGFLTRALELNPGDRILEFGPGWGNTTLQFRQMGHPVTAVDVNPLFLDVIRLRLKKLGLDVETAAADMLEFRSPTRFERVVFFECFHHCSDHVRMIRNLDQLVAPGGMVVFGGEPITDDCPMPWGLRLDGMSVWSTRKYGWLELGFRTDYFRELLHKHGWTSEMHESNDVAWMRAITARKN